LFTEWRASGGEKRLVSIVQIIEIEPRIENNITYATLHYVDGRALELQEEYDDIKSFLASIKAFLKGSTLPEVSPPADSTTFTKKTVPRFD
jgi:hypothetical protein